MRYEPAAASMEITETKERIDPLIICDGPDIHTELSYKSNWAQSGFCLKFVAQQLFSPPLI